MTVYAKIENNKLICASNNLGITGLADSPELCEANGFTAYTEEEISGYFAGNYEIIDGVLTDISETPEYIAEQEAKAKAIQKIELQKQIDELDIKRIRATAEPSLKEDDKTWLEYYTEQIQELRNQIQGL